MKTTLGRLLVAAVLAGGLGVAASTVAREARGAQQPAPPSAQEPDESLEEFVPTEEIPPGSEVSFPVDI